MAWWSKVKSAYQKVKKKVKEVATKYVQRQVSKPARAIETVKKVLGKVSEPKKPTKPIPQPSYEPRRPSPTTERQGFTALPVAPQAQSGGVSPSGWENVKDVYTVSLNPFSKDKVVATTKNKVFNSVAEFVANHPYETALMATGAIGLIRGGASLAGLGKGKVIYRGGIGKTVLPSLQGTGRIATNTKTTALFGNLFVAKGFSLIAAAWITKEAIETYPFAKFEIAESLDKLGYARVRAAEAGRYDIVEGLDAYQDEILNPSGWEAVLSVIPWANVYRAAARNIAAAEESRKVFNKLIDDIKIQQETGETEDKKWERIRQEEQDQKIALIDYYNDERKKLLIWERDAEVAGRDEDAKFWRNERAKQRKLEEADRIAIAEFWYEYRKKTQKLRAHSLPSNLGFGLL